MFKVKFYYRYLKHNDNYMRCANTDNIMLHKIKEKTYVNCSIFNFNIKLYTTVRNVDIIKVKFLKEIEHD